MPEYEICILKEDRYSASSIVEQIHSNDRAAITAAADLAKGSAFEVWRDLDCVYGLASSHPLRIVPGTELGCSAPRQLNNRAPLLP